MDEAEQIYHSIFKDTIPLQLKKRFQEASKDLSAGYTQEEIVEYNRALQKTSDLEALELVVRHMNKLPLLVMKFHLMIYLAETIPGCRDFFINRSDTRFAGWIYLFLSGWRTIFKFLKGLFLLVVNKI